MTHSVISVVYVRGDLVSAVIKVGKIDNQLACGAEDFQLIHGIDVNLSHKADTGWMRFNLNLMDHLYHLSGGNKDSLRALYDEESLEDAHWQWLRKAMTYASDDYEWFYLLVEEEVQGICVFYHPKKSRIDSEDIFYIEYVATAPWNRKSSLGAPKFKGIGTTLLRESLLHSMEKLGYRPGFSLHSLPKATAYYEKIGMLNFGPDSGCENLNYFEMGRDNSEVFASG
jgi:hypothetical protein